MSSQVDVIGKCLLNSKKKYLRFSLLRMFRVVLTLIIVRRNRVRSINRLSAQINSYCLSFKIYLHICKSYFARNCFASSLSSYCLNSEIYLPASIGSCSSPIYIDSLLSKNTLFGGTLTSSFALHVWVDPGTDILSSIKLLSWNLSDLISDSSC